jgi:5'-nucleotidase
MALNSSINVIYQVQMSAAIEAGVEGIPAIGFHCVIIIELILNKMYVKTIAENVLKHGLDTGTNFLNASQFEKKDTKGIKICGSRLKPIGKKNLNVKTPW